jgi:hypothetical protein
MPLLRKEQPRSLIITDIELGKFQSVPHAAAPRLRTRGKTLIIRGPVQVNAKDASRPQTVGVLCGFDEEEKLRRMGADEILLSTADLRRVLKARG